MFTYIGNLFGVNPFYGAILTFIIVGILYWCLTSSRHENADKMATGGYSTLRELKKFNKPDGIQLSKNFTLTEKMCYEHVCVIGPTGAGKTTSIFYPNLLQKSSFAKGNSSLIITDPKGEQYKDTSYFQESVCGRKTVLFSPYEPQYSFKYNPLVYCKTESEVIALAGNLLAVGGKAMEIQSGKSGGGGSDWINMAKPLWAAALLHIWHQPDGIKTIPYALDLILNATQEQLQAILGESKYDNVRRQFNSFNQAAGSERTVSSIKITLSSNLQLYSDPIIRELVSRNTFDLGELRKNPTALYISYPERKSAEIAPLLSIFFSQAINSLMEDKNLVPDYLPTFFLFDEFANIGIIPGFANLVSTVRSRKISFLCCLQSKEQLVQLYGRENEGIIMANLKTKAIYGALQDIPTTEYVSKLCGDVEIRTKSKSVSDNENRANSYSYSTSKKKLLTPDEVMRISKSNILLLVHNNKPYMDKTNTFYTQSKYTNNIREVKKHIE